MSKQTNRILWALEGRHRGSKRAVWHTICGDRSRWVLKGKRNQFAANCPEWEYRIVVYRPADP